MKIHDIIFLLIVWFLLHWRTSISIISYPIMFSNAYRKIIFQQKYVFVINWLYLIHDCPIMVRFFGNLTEVLSLILNSWLTTVTYCTYWWMDAVFSTVFKFFFYKLLLYADVEILMLVIVHMFIWLSVLIFE